jgi:hypothetical protein
MSKPRYIKPAGQVRRSQLLTTFGPGALIELPKHSALVGGLDHWSPLGEQILEPRLVEKLKNALQRNELTLYAPPPANDDPTAPPTGVIVWQFPEWFIAQELPNEHSADHVRRRQLVHRSSLTNASFIDRDKQRRDVVPVRFVRACVRGHISDIEWGAFVHGRDSICRRTLWIDERGTSGDLTNIVVRCECGMERPLAEAAMQERGNVALGKCNGARPWLGPSPKEHCELPSRLLVRTASNAYFSQTMSVISLPDADESLTKAIDQVWEAYLQYVDDLDDLKKERAKKPPVANALNKFSDEDVFAAIELRRNPKVGDSAKSVKQVEFETLAACPDEMNYDRSQSDFVAHSLDRAVWDRPWLKSRIERVVLVHRLREVIAQVGFTRFEPSAPDFEGELEVGVQRAPLAAEATWLPAVENRGEGFFLQFNQAAVDDWTTKKTVESRGLQLLAGLNKWKTDHPKSGSQPDRLLQFFLLHSLSHLLITAVALECGYPASSIRERIYVGSAGYGILLYTGSPDAEGTLGGLVQAGRHIEGHLRSALKLAALCSNDPVCSFHRPDDEHEGRFLHGAACHGCLFVSETSCERFNDYLDRALVVPTVEQADAAFFEWDLP